MNMAEFIQITTTTETEEDARRIAHELVSRRCAACVQVVGPIKSVYRWQGNVEESTEWRCDVKTITLLALLALLLDDVT